MKGRRPFTPLGAVHPDPGVGIVPDGDNTKRDQGTAFAQRNPSFGTNG